MSSTEWIDEQLRSNRKSHLISLVCLWIQSKFSSFCILMWWLSRIVHNQPWLSWVSIDWLSTKIHKTSSSLFVQCSLLIYYWPTFSGANWIISENSRLFFLLQGAINVDINLISMHFLFNNIFYHKKKTLNHKKTSKMENKMRKNVACGSSYSTYFWLRSHHLLYQYFYLIFIVAIDWYNVSINNNWYKNRFENFLLNIPYTTRNWMDE